MSLQLTKKNIIYGGLGVFVTSCLLIGGYYFLLNPLNKEIELKQNELSTEEKLYETLAEKAADKNNDVIENTMKLQRKLPVEPFLEQFILDLEKAEVISNSFIEQMTFSDAEMNAKEIIETTPPTEQTEQAATAEEQLQNDAAGNNEAAPENDTQETGQADVPTIPEEMKRITVTLTVNSSNYFDMLKFLDVIEHFQRITKVDSLTFSGGEEIKSVDDKKEELSYTIVLSTFYYPKLEELKKDLPPFETPPPSNKKNPLADGMFTQENTNGAPNKGDNNQSQLTKKQTTTGTTPSPSNQKSTEVKKPMEETKSINKQAIMSGNSKTSSTKVTENRDFAQSGKEIYTVEKGDTLYSISMKLLKANKVEEIIKLNNLDSEKITIGQKLKLPNE